MKQRHTRKPNRMPNYDYSQSGAYFITICVKNRHLLLWEHSKNIDPKPKLSEYGQIIDNAIHQIPQHYPHVSVEKYVIMPNHIHLLLLLAQNPSQPTSVSTIINQMKGAVTKQIGFSLWQKLFHDHIIRNEQEYKQIWQYIDQNPANWTEDCYYTIKL